jgi:hypothetical protein
MKKYALLALVVAMVGFGVKQFFFPPCTPATNDNVLVALFNCVRDFETNREKYQARACKEIRNEGPDCIFEDKDTAAVMAFSQKLGEECIVNNLKKQNICTDKLQEFFGE